MRTTVILALAAAFLALLGSAVYFLFFPGCASKSCCEPRGTTSGRSDILEVSGHTAQNDNDAPDETDQTPADEDETVDEKHEPSDAPTTDTRHTLTSSSSLRDALFAPPSESKTGPLVSGAVVAAEEDASESAADDAGLTRAMDELRAYAEGRTSSSREDLEQMLEAFDSSTHDRAAFVAGSALNAEEADRGHAATRRGQVAMLSEDREQLEKALDIRRHFSSTFFESKDEQAKNDPLVKRLRRLAEDNPERAFELERLAKSLNSVRAPTFDVVEETRKTLRNVARTHNTMDEEARLAYQHAADQEDPGDRRRRGTREQKLADAASLGGFLGLPADFDRLEVRDHFLAASN